TFQLDDTFTLTPTPGHSPGHCCVNIRSRGQQAVVTGDMMHHALQCREPGWSTIWDTDPVQAALSRRRFLGQVADTGTFVLPIHFPSPTTGLIAADGDRFPYTFVRYGRQRITGQHGDPFADMKPAPERHEAQNVAFGSFATNAAGPACHLMSA